MGNYEELKAAVVSVIKTNGNQEITGQVLQNTLTTLISQVGANATFAGIATPDTAPGAPDQNVFYIATENGQYVNFDGITVTDEVAILTNKNGSWAKSVTGIALLDAANRDIFYNVSFNFPNDGIDGTNKYTLQTAIEKVPQNLRVQGLKCIFMNNSNTTLDSWTFQGGKYTDLGRWIPTIFLGSRVLLISTLSDFSTLDNVKDTGMYYISGGAFRFWGILRVYYGGYNRKSIIQEYSGIFCIKNGGISNGYKNVEHAFRIFNISDSDLKQEIPFDTWSKWEYSDEKVNKRIFSSLSKNVITSVLYENLLIGSITGNNTYYHTNLIPVDNNTRIDFCLRIKGDYFIKFYTKEKNFISGITAPGATSQTAEYINIIPPSNAKFVQFQTMNELNSEFEQYNYYINIYSNYCINKDLELYVNSNLYDVPFSCMEQGTTSGSNVNYVVTPYISVLHDFPILVSLRIKGDSIGAWYDKNKQQISIIKSGFVGQDFGNVVKTLIAPKEASFFRLITMSDRHPDYEKYEYYIKIPSIANCINNNNSIKNGFVDIYNDNWKNGTIDNSIINTYIVSDYIPINPYSENVSLSIRIKGGKYLAFYDKDNNEIQSYRSDTGQAENIIDERFAPTNAVSFRVCTMKPNHAEYEDYNFFLKKVFYKVNDAFSYNVLPSLELWAAQEINYNDGSYPISKNYLFSSNGENFYFARNKYGDGIEFAFKFDKTLQNKYASDYSCAVLPNGDVMFIYKSEAVPAGTTSDDWQLPPIIYEKNNNYKPLIVDFGDSIKPGGWLQNVGFNAIYPYNCLILGEYTRATAEKARIWKVEYPYNKKENWKIVKEFDVDYTTLIPNSIKHIHTIQFDQFTGFVYACTGDENQGSNIWISKDEGETWEFVFGPSEKYCRLLNFVFTEDYVYWATDSPTDSLHFLFKAQRNENGVINVGDAEELTQLLQPETGMLLATYGLSYVKKLNVLMLLERVDGGGWEWMPLRLWDLNTNQLKTIGKIYSISGQKENIGFRCQYLELYPKDDSIICGYNNFFSYRNKNKLLGNVNSSLIGTRINNILLRLGYTANNVNITFETIYK